jgi:predicted nucleic acid-binding protein
MREPILLDAGPLGRIVHPRSSPDNDAAKSWLDELLAREIVVIVPEIADYEIRREAIRLGSIKTIRRLDRLTLQLTYLPLDTETMRLAAELWAEARRMGQAAANDASLDADMILVAQARLAGGMVASENVEHLARFVNVRHWRDLAADSL